MVAKWKVYREYPTDNEMAVRAKIEEMLDIFVARIEHRPNRASLLSRWIKGLKKRNRYFSSLIDDMVGNLLDDWRIDEIPDDRR